MGRRSDRDATCRADADGTDTITRGATNRVFMKTAPVLRANDGLPPARRGGIPRWPGSAIQEPCQLSRCSWRRKRPASWHPVRLAWHRARTAVPMKAESTASA